MTIVPSVSKKRNNRSEYTNYLLCSIDIYIYIVHDNNMTVLGSVSDIIEKGNISTV